MWPKKKTGKNSQYHKKNHYFYKQVQQNQKKCLLSKLLYTIHTSYTDQYITTGSQYKILYYNIG